MGTTRMQRHTQPRSIWNLNPFFEDFFAPSGSQPSTLRPALDVSENEHAVTVTAELPGMSKEQVNLTIEDGVLTIWGEKRSEDERKEEQFHVTERSYGSFSRSITLPKGVDVEKAKANFENGLLRVVLPKQEEVKPRRLEID